MACLAKSREDRPASAAEVLERLARCRLDDWTQAEASAWWDAHPALSAAHRQRS